LFTNIVVLRLEGFDDVGGGIIGAWKNDEGKSVTRARSSFTNPLTIHKANGLKMRLGRKPRRTQGLFNIMINANVKNPKRIREVIEDPRQSRHFGRLTWSQMNSEH
jgi:hypothetical protein